MKINLKKTNLKILSIAVTGGPGSGKTAVCNCFKELHVPVISLDVLARKAVMPGTAAYHKILQHFGNMVINKNGLLNRSGLRSIIIKDQSKKKLLEDITHPEILKLMRKKMKEAEKKGEKMVVVEVPLLYETGMEKEFDIVIAIKTKSDLQVNRLVSRDNVSLNDARGLINAQMTQEEKARRADFIIENMQSMEKIRTSVGQIYQSLLKNL
ncbi:Dephospho-CoA kinase [Candidatus Magnetomoraceae bacterium gMMP-1]